MYKIEILPQADKDIRAYQKAGNSVALRKIQDIIKELTIHPTSGKGKPEQLKYEPKLSDSRSRLRNCKYFTE